MQCCSWSSRILDGKLVSNWLLINCRLYYSRGGGWSVPSVSNVPFYFVSKVWASFAMKVGACAAHQYCCSHTQSHKVPLSHTPILETIKQLFQRGTCRHMHACCVCAQKVCVWGGVCVCVLCVGRPPAAILNYFLVIAFKLGPGSEGRGKEPENIRKGLTKLS